MNVLIPLVKMEAYVLKVSTLIPALAQVASLEISVKMVSSTSIMQYWLSISIKSFYLVKMSELII